MHIMYSRVSPPLNHLDAGRLLGGFSTYQSRRRSRLAFAKTVNLNALALRRHRKQRLDMNNIPTFSKNHGNVDDVFKDMA